MYIKISKAGLTKAIIIIVAFAVFDFILNLTLYNPQFITPIYSFVLRQHLLSNESTGYPLIKIGTLNSGTYSAPRAAVIGTVTDVLKSGDGDWHINIQSNSGTLVAEIIPEYPLTVPSVGEKVKIWGITRYDIAHRWWELHPVIGLQKI